MNSAHLALLDEHLCRDYTHMFREPGGRCVLCRSGARAEKERAMSSRQSERLTAGLLKTDAWLRRAPQQDLETVGRRIGRRLGKNPAAAVIIEAQVEHDAKVRRLHKTRAFCPTFQHP